MQAVQLASVTRELLSAWWDEQRRERQRVEACKDTPQILLALQNANEDKFTQ